MKLNKKIHTIMILMLIGSSTLYASGIPVFDGGNAAQNAANFVKQIAEMKKQFDNQVKQIKELQSQVQAITGNKNMGQILKDQAIKQLPTEWESVYNEVSGDYKKITDPKQYRSDDGLLALANNYEASQQAYKDIMAGFKRIEGLMDQINQTGDLKASQDLQNRIAIEQSNIQNNQMRLDMMARIVEQERSVRQHRRAEIYACLRQAKDKNTRLACGSI